MPFWGEQSVLSHHKKTPLKHLGKPDHQRGKYHALGFNVISDQCACKTSGHSQVLAYLKGTDKKCEEHFDVAQNACRLLICSKDENHLMNSKQRNEGKSCLGEPKKMQIKQIGNLSHCRTMICLSLIQLTKQMLRKLAEVCNRCNELGCWLAIWKIWPSGSSWKSENLSVDQKIIICIVIYSDVYHAKYYEPCNINADFWDYLQKSSYKWS